MHQMNIQKDINEESMFLVMQLPTVTQKLVNQFTNGSKITESLPVIQNQLNKVLSTSNCDKLINLKTNVVIPKIKDIQKSTLKTDSHIKTVRKVPVLKITINKRYNKPFVPNINQNTHKLSTLNTETKNESNIKICHCLENNAQNISLCAKPDVQNVISTVFKKPTNYKNSVVETRNVYTPKFVYTRKGDLSRDQSRTQTSAERIQYLYTKAKRDCHMLRMRLKALRERYLREKEEIKRLRIYLQYYYKYYKEENVNGVSERYSKKSKLLMFSQNTEEEKNEGYEKLLRKVRKIKQEILDNEILISENCGETILIDT